VEFEMRDFGLKSGRMGFIWHPRFEIRNSWSGELQLVEHRLPQAEGREFESRRPLQF